MKAAVLHQRGQPPSYEEFRDPEPGDGEALLDVIVAGINPIDLAIGAGKVPAREREHPSVPGVEGIGEREGRRFYFDTPVAPFGSMAERVTVAEECLIELPADLDEGLAVSLGVAGLAAWLALEWRAELREGESVLVLGASGVVGQIAVQVAKLLGAGKVVAAARDEASLERARHELGADAVVEIGGEGDLTERLREAVGGGYDVVVDPLWGEPAEAALAALNQDGRLIAIGNAAGATATIEGRGFRDRLGRVIGHTNFRASQEVKTRAYEALAARAAAGEIKVRIGERPLYEAGEAWRAQGESPHVKQVLRVR